ncbi:hypothetical protein CPB84DRAFT_1792699 [Gymnopilus junonius]|uniref:RBR-type E3 ubiquitin transferase n=1 Tax=Gymnopilus junonius TaxID=109634 RepID=A0A9P5NCY0_GYMJU|nr:hypothetical protein CPB84DRAFT_1792699 [Gymnopilus junonius]
MEEAREKARTLDRIIFNGHLIRAQMNEPPRGVALRHFVNSSVKIRGLPPNSSFGTDFVALTGTQNHRCLNSTSYDLEDSFTTIREILSQAQGVRMDTYEKLEDGLGLEGDAKIKVQFEDWGDAKKAQESVEQIGRLNSPTYKAWCPPTPVRYTIRIPRQQYEAQRKQWDALSEKKQGVDAHVLQKIGDRGDIVFIQVMGQDKKAVGILKVRVESLVAGEKLNSTYWHSSFASKSLRRSDFKTRSLRVFGDQQMVVDARQMIKDEVDSLAKREVTRTIDPGQIGFFMREGLDKLKELLGEENVRLNLAARPWTITVKGGEEATHHLQRLIEEARAALTLGSIILPGQIIEKDICPVCYDDASNPEQLGCGHTYCSGCLKHFLSSAVDGKTFPLVCAGNEATCNVPISIPLIQRFLPAQAFRALVESAFSVHLEQHGQEFKYCTTPDCKQIYRRRTDQVTLQCPSCFSTICSACDEEAHEDMTCEERRVLNSPEEQERLNEQLATQSGYKKCPQCKIWIEKTEGCNHMTCKCGAHICWRCMGIFTETTIYDHMREAHGNIYDNVPEGVQMGNMAHNAFLANQVDELARIERLRAAERERQEAAARTAAQLNRQRIENQRQRDEQAAAEQRRRREREEAEVEVRRRVDALRPAQQRVWDERQTEEEQLRRRLAELNERWDGDAQGAAQQLQEIRGRQQQQQNRNGCIVM